MVPQVKIVRRRDYGVVVDVIHEIGICHASPPDNVIKGEHSSRINVVEE